MRISDWSSDVCSSDLSSACFSRRSCGVSAAFSSDSALEASSTLLRTISDWRRITAWAPSRAILLAEATRSEEHTSELQSLMRISYAVFCLKKKTTQHGHTPNTNDNKS